MNLKSTFRYIFLFLFFSLSFSSVTKGQNKITNPSITVGDLKVRMLRDVQIYLQVSLLSGIEHSEANKMVGNKDSALTPVNAFFIQTPHHLVLVDAGMGKVPGEESGFLVNQLKEAGVTPADIDLILITHFHFDHIGGLISQDGKRAFPNATVRVSQVESDFWLRDSSLIPTDLRARAAMIKSVLSPYISAKAYLPFSSNENLGDGIKPLAANGHTVGHTVFAFPSKGNSLWCIGDLIHFGDIQFKQPNVAIVFDSNSPMAIASRNEFFQQAAKEHITLAGAHLPEVIRIEKNGDAFVATPVSSH